MYIVAGFDKTVEVAKTSKNAGEKALAVAKLHIIRFLGRHPYLNSIVEIFLQAFAVILGIVLAILAVSALLALVGL
jgi:hypothetical protein